MIKRHELVKEICRKVGVTRVVSSAEYFTKHELALLNAWIDLKIHREETATIEPSERKGSDGANSRGNR